MSCRRLVGIDLGIASAHTVRVLDGEGNTVAKRRAWPTVESLGEVETAALAGCPAGTRLEVVVEPTGPAWLPIAVFFDARGHVVHRVSSAKAADLRRFLSRHTKTNGIDADTLARLPLFDPAGLRPLQLPGVERAALDRRVRATDRLTRAGAEHKVRIKDLVRQLLPMTPLSGDLGAADLAVLERCADPNTLVKLGEKRLTALIEKTSKGHQGIDRARQWISAAEAAIALYAGHSAVAFTDWPPRSPPRSACCGRSRPSSPATPPNASPATAGSIPTNSLVRCPASPQSAAPPSSQPWATPPASLAASSSGPSPGSPPEHRRPATPTARANPCPRPARRCCAQPLSAPPTMPANSTPSSPAPTTSRWSNGAKTTSAPSASSPPTSPNAPGQ
jgi:Transposase